MKTVYFLLCTFVVCLTQTNGGLVPDNVLHGLLNAPNKLNTAFKDAVNDAITFQNSDEDEKPSFQSPPQVSTTPAAVSQPITTPVAVAQPTTTTVAPANGTATEKDGRENFAGGCSTGFKRTPDGRCMPTL